MKPLVFVSGRLNDLKKIVPSELNHWRLLGD